MTYYFIKDTNDEYAILTNTTIWSGWKASFEYALYYINIGPYSHKSKEFLLSPKEYIKISKWSLELELDHLPSTYEELTSNYPELFL